ncbi:ATP-binding cassette domain-containing protein [archaeon]|nr:ATP-binding cassette domain-containing protein [archaeon]MBT4351087.1 ATP-binding cassette domain-containing protein [archaeon]MBT4648105.1 ATP-binding cassette domain-containing protein [archaeon]MBT6822543.1 ATP-binding cassette domain-containing protein [archaeon]MBT7392544.1 ATP-binding cassette domain-containing protein [archaeon]
MIEVKNLKKEFKTFSKGHGIKDSIKSLIKRNYSTVKALNDINFKIEKGEIRGFIGPNGAGKSTTIKILCGILFPTSGQVKVNGFEPWSQRKKYVKNIGVVFGQKSQLWFDLPPIDTYHLNKAIYDIPDTKFKKTLDYLVNLLEIKDIIYRPTRQLSLGEKMKCELVSSLLHGPDIVFLDEPTIGLDIISKEKIRQFIKKINREKQITFLLTTHDMDDIEDLCKNIIIINKGDIVFDGELSKIKSEVMKTKILDIKFKEKITSKDIKKITKGCIVREQKDYEARISVNLKKTTIQKVMNDIVNEFSIHDINISNPRIETIIKRIYEK